MILDNKRKTASGNQVSAISRAILQAVEDRSATKEANNKAHARACENRADEVAERLSPRHMHLALRLCGNLSKTQ
jgi:hypothetical protein